MSDDDLAFLEGGGEMGALIREFDWANNELGPPQHWPQPLKTALRILLTTGHPMFIWWGPNLIQFYNDPYRRSIGPERHPSALGQAGHECWAEIWDIISPQINYVLEGNGYTWNENHLVPITRSGQREDVYWTYSYGPIDDPAAPNGVGGVLVVCAETTETIKEVEANQLAERRWRERFDHMVGFICILMGPELVFEYANPQYLKLIGQRDIIGKTIGDALPEVIDQGFVTLLEKVYETGEPYKGTATPVQLLQPNGKLEQLYVDFLYQPIQDKAGKVIGILADGSDVTERVLSSQRLLADDRRKDEFLAMLAHELRNPLAPVRNVAELLIRSTTAESEYRVLGEMLSRQARHLTRIVDDLLDVSRITQGKIELQYETVCLHDALRLAIETVKPEADKKQLALVYEKQGAGIYAKADLTRIVQCFTNVLTNSIKYSDVGAITIGLSVEDGNAKVQISDQGIGISETMLSNIFEMFVQVENSLDRANGGLGIGLSVVKSLLAMHGGSIKAESEGLGHGSRFTLYLPLINDVALDQRQAPKISIDSKNILVVDDNRDSATSLARILEFDGHTVVTLFSAHEALAFVADSPPDVVLLDIGLPEINGYEVARRLRAGGFKSALFAATGYGQADDVQRAIVAGFDEHLVKPIDIPKLLALIAKAKSAG